MAPRPKKQKSVSRFFPSVDTTQRTHDGVQKSPHPGAMSRVQQMLQDKKHLEDILTRLTADIKQQQVDAGTLTDELENMLPEIQQATIYAQGDDDLIIVKAESVEEPAMSAFGSGRPAEVEADMSGAEAEIQLLKDLNAALRHEKNELLGLTNNYTEEDLVSKMLQLFQAIEQWVTYMFGKFENGVIDILQVLQFLLTVLQILL
ncbi:hypothetical protein BDZ85DRAFT_13900 [Elsinoe ampelina]|uniref:Uncharacterized protein n=1 Tax=Elsinoe ampelina TaxID=302913 RepID=A0A6A6GRQ8_9PEZI|nr:hypothetical protein BDZ85DRAFT_13900 [Elsinoe ampelina]